MKSNPTIPDENSITIQLFQPDSFDKLNALDSCKFHESKKQHLIRNGAHLTKIK